MTWDYLHLWDKCRLYACIKWIHCKNHQSSVITAIGNVTKTAEYNFYIDPEAAHIVLNCSELLMTMVTWETCLDSSLTFVCTYLFLTCYMWTFSSISSNL